MPSYGWEMFLFPPAAAAECASAGSTARQEPWDPDISSDLAAHGSMDCMKGPPVDFSVDFPLEQTEGWDLEP